MGHIHYVNRNVFANVWGSEHLEIMFFFFLIKSPTLVDINT